MNELKVFENVEFGNVRMVEIDGKMMAVGVDVARALGYLHPSQTINYHCKGIVKLPIPSTNQHGTIVMQDTKVITEGDIYRLIVKAADQSKSLEIKEKAERFENWVFNEVLPSIRKNGIYATEVTVEKMLSDPDFAIELLTTLKEERAKRLEVEKTNTILMHVTKNYTATEIAKELGLKSATELNKILSQMKVQYKQNETWVLYSKYADKGYTDIKQQVLDSGRVVYDRKWTQTGRKFLLELFDV